MARHSRVYSSTIVNSNPLYQDLTYTFTADGNVDLITDPINGNQDFGYDALDRLTSATGPYGASGAATTFSYTYL